MERSSHARTIVTATLTFLAVVVALPVAANTASKLKLRPGEYELVVTYEIQGEPSSRPTITRQCITPDELDSPEEVFSESAPNERKAGEPCKVKNLRESGPNISYDAECPNRLVRVQGIVRRNEFSVVRNVRSKTTHGVSLKFTLQGRRTGGCPPDGTGRKH